MVCVIRPHDVCSCAIGGKLVVLMHEALGVYYEHNYMAVCLYPLFIEYSTLLVRMRKFSASLVKVYQNML